MNSLFALVFSRSSSGDVGESCSGEAGDATL